MDFPMAEQRSWKEPIDQPSACADSNYCYPGGHATFSSTVFLSLYDEEESREQPVWNEAYSGVDRSSGLASNEMAEAANRPTIYHLLRLFDSIRGFHKGYLDLSGRHPERYYNLQSQWNRYLCSFLGLETEIRSCGDHGGMSRYQIAFNAERWHRFQLKWRLPESASYCQLLKCTQKVLRELKQHPAPHFQIIRLIDLPVEVLDNIVGLASTSQAKALSCTCHKLNDIGQRHIFRTWRMKLHVPPHISPFNVEYSSIDLPTLAYYSRQDLEKSARFLIETPHISQRIQRLVLTDEWWVSRRAHPHEANNPFALANEFYRSVTMIFGSALKVAPRLSVLVLCNLEVNLELMKAMREIGTLHTLELHLCHIPRTVLRKLVASASASDPASSSDMALVCPQVSNLRIYMDSSFQETHSQWASLLMCPNIRTLSVVQFGIGAFPAPEAAFWTKCRLDNLERLALDNIDLGDLAELVRFLANGDAGARMTHFKLHMDWGVPDAEVLTLLSSLHTSHAPLDVLVLEGLSEAEFELFDAIGAFFPDLVALTLVRRQNASQHQNKLAIWPHMSWEYAERMGEARKAGGFRRLRHFCWNFRTEYWDATPRALLGFESGFEWGDINSAGTSACASDSSSSSGNGAVPTEDVPYFLDSHWMALPFAAHCPTLRSFSLMDRTVDMVCRITPAGIGSSASGGGGRGGAKVLTPKYYPTLGSFSWSGCGSGQEYQWNTTASHWPTLAPLSNRNSSARMTTVTARSG